MISTPPLTWGSPGWTRTSNPSVNTNLCRSVDDDRSSWEICIRSCSQSTPVDVIRRRFCTINAPSFVIMVVAARIAPTDATCGSHRKTRFTRVHNSAWAGVRPGRVNRGPPTTSLLIKSTGIGQQLVRQPQSVI
jgi:hypothetical protein